MLRGFLFLCNRRVIRLMAKEGIVFSVKYLAWFALFYLLFFIESFSPFYLLQSMQTGLTIWLTQWWIEAFSIPVNMVGNTVHLKNGFDIWILDSCNGLLAYLMYVAAVLSYPALFFTRFIWVLEGYLYLLIVNSFRIDFVIYVTMFDKDYFTCAHDCVGRVMLISMVAGLFILFTLRVHTVRIIRKVRDRRAGLHDRRVAHGHEWRAPQYERRKGQKDRRSHQERRH